MNPQALIIEDHFELGDIFADLLTFMGIQAEVVRDGKLAAQRLKEVVPEIVLLDMHLPNVSGRQLLAQIRADQRLSQTKVLVMTADSQQGESLRREADVVFIKPVALDQIQTTILCLRAH